MASDHQKIQQRLKAFDFTGLFTQELMWNHFPSRAMEVPVDGATYSLKPIAQRGMAVFVCVPPTDAQFPKYAVRRKIDTQVSKTAREHVIIFHDEAKTVQVWQWVKREAGKPSACREQIFYTGQSGDALVQKIQGIAFGLEDEANVAETVAKVGAAFDVEKVTKKFYELFKKEHDAFLKFTKGIPDEKLQRWYASVMLNRLMFIYFIQKKGFLGGDQQYLSNKLAESKKRGKDNFYRDLLCPLFFEGFAKREDQRSDEVNKLLGRVPYLNGGLFLKHQIEELLGKTIEVPDKAFEKIFDFFEQYDWHLDDRPTRTGREINPDVLGYVFEKYINQKEMGAYYTKEDITEYISKNTIIPALFDIARRSCQIAFDGEHSVWRILQNDPNRYIPLAMMTGIEKELPKHIAEGLKDVSKRGDWNRQADPKYALATETWREVVARRNRCAELRSKLTSGAIGSISDLITCNLDIARFAEDVIANEEHGHELVWSFFCAIRELSVLDPTCGSGAFLFAALNILEPLYEACVWRMEAFIDDLERSGEKYRPEKLKHFRDVLEHVKRHPSRRYFIFKTIILNNLYGVDIMEEATEICKLRLFLKLVAQVEPGGKVEPLPDIDFNIRAGNTLVGFVSRQSVQDAGESKLGFDNTLVEIDERAQLVDKAFHRFREMQVSQAMDAVEFAQAKQELRNRLKVLRDELDAYLAGEYGIKDFKGEGLQKWRDKHQPFHWFVEFYGIMKRGGFDVIIGNPPYLELKEVDYVPRGFRTCDTSAIHAMCIERSAQLLAQTGTFSMIVPLSLISTQRMPVAQNMIEAQRDVWYANFSWRPGKLFDTVNRALTIFVAVPARSEGETFTTDYQKWTSDTRALLFPTITFTRTDRRRPAFWVAKIREQIETGLIRKFLSVDTNVAHFIAPSSYRVYYRTDGGLYWKVFTDFPPAFVLNGKKGHSTRETWITLAGSAIIRPMIAVLSSDLFWWWYTVTSNCRHLNPYDVHNFPVPRLALTDSQLASLGEEYLEDITRNSTMLLRNQKQTGRTETQSFKIQKSKRILERIDTALAPHYQLTAEELDFVVNYDWKFRLGADEESDESSTAAAN